MLAAYPEFSCRGEKYVIAPYSNMSRPRPGDPPIPYGVMCAGNDAVFAFLDDVLDEVIEMFPSPYIHIGGDECPKQFWANCPKCQARMKAEHLADEKELQSWFIRRVEKMINARGRKMLGLSEIGGRPRAERSADAWLSAEDGSLRRGRIRRGDGAEVALYFDYGCNDADEAGVLVEPVPPELEPGYVKHVLGAQACMWTHIARTEPDIDGMILPRLLALAEVTWTPADQRSWPDFSRRLDAQVPRIKRLGFSQRVEPDAP